MSRFMSRGLYAAALLAAVALSGAALAAPQARAAHATASSPQAITLYVLTSALTKRAGYLGPDKRYHDSILPAIIVLKAGQPVRVTVLSYDEGLHTITVPSLNLNIMIKGGKEMDKETAEQHNRERSLGLGETTAPGATSFMLNIKKPGTYRWFCAMPCDDGAGRWAMAADTTGPGKVGYMAGYIVVV